MPGDGPLKISDEQARQVLERAARIDASDRLRVSVPDLRSAAVEAGISTSALDQALNEITNPPTATEIAAGKYMKLRRKWVYAAAIAAIIMLLGIAQNLFFQGGELYVQYPPSDVEVELPPPPPPPPPPPG